MNTNDVVYVINWGKCYSNITKWNDETQKRECIFPIKTKIPDYSGIEFHSQCNYEPNLTIKGTVNKTEPQKLVSRTPIYKDYKYEILETFKHPKAGEYIQEEAVREKWNMYDKYTENNILVLASTHTDKAWMKCYVIIEESGVSVLTPTEYNTTASEAFLNSQLNKWDRNTIDKRNLPKELISVFYDEDDRVLFGSNVIRGLVTYEYIDGKYSIDNKPIYICSSISYDGKGNKGCPDKSLIKPFAFIKNYIEQN